MTSIHPPLSWHPGETHMHTLLHTPPAPNPTSPFLTPFCARVLQHSPLLAIGALDSSGRPWTSLWGGEEMFARPVAASVVGVKTVVDRRFDPVLEVLLGGKDGVVRPAEGEGKMVSALAIDLDKRMRAKLFGRMVAGAVEAVGEAGREDIGEVQLVMRIEQSLANCPKYINRKTLIPTPPTPTLLTTTLPLPPSALSLLHHTDLFFLTTSHSTLSMSTNYRGGPPGFLRILTHTPTSLTLIYPEYSGNRLYQTLGNLTTTPLAGLLIPDFRTGAALYLSCRTEILHGAAASAILPHITLAVKLTVEALRYVQHGLAFRADPGEASPYNPRVRLLADERTQQVGVGETGVYAQLRAMTVLAPSIARFRFGVEGGGGWRAGQYVVLDFAGELDAGYSHMRDDDPESLNDDFIRTFTVVSAPEEGRGEREFEITIRRVGRVTEHLFRCGRGRNGRVRDGISVPVRGFGGEFFVKQEESGDDGNRTRKSVFVAAGVGITPLLAQASRLDLDALEVLWTIRREDLGLVRDTIERVTGLGRCVTLFITGTDDEGLKDEAEGIVDAGVRVRRRRMEKGDLLGEEGGEDKVWYLCTGLGFRKTLLGWLEGRTVVYEDFNY